MPKIDLKNNLLLILFSIIPVSIILGPVISVINIFFLIISFLFYYRNKNLLDLLKDKVVILLIIINLYLLFNSFVSIDYTIGLVRNLGFFRFILLFFTINYLFSNNKKTDIAFNFWLLVSLIVMIDVFIEFFVGKNILGYSQSYSCETCARIVSFFKDEPIVGGYLNGIIFVIFGFLFSNFDKKKKNKKFYIFLFILIFFLCMLITGERSNTIKFILGLVVFMSLNPFIKFKFKLISLIVVILVCISAYLSSDKIKLRYGGQLINLIDSKEKRDLYLKENTYLNLYRSGIEVFKKYPIKGVGNKNYRIETCGYGSNPKYFCNTHPHQIYIEFLSEHGLAGSLLFLSVIFFLIFKNFRVMIVSKNSIQLGSFCFLLINFIPILPSGSFFTDFNATFFWLNFSIFYASNSKTNIFSKQGD
jgi:hypothetical protein